MLQRLRSLADRHPTIGPLLCIASLQYFVIQLVVALKWSPPYSISRNTISDLGVTTCARFNARYVCSPLHDVMNLSFVLLGVTMITACAVLRRSFRDQGSRSLSIGFALVGSGGVGVLAVGIFPENSIPLFHGIGAALPFVLGNIGVALLGFSLPVPLAFRLFTLTCGFAALTALVFYAISHFLGFGEGGMERIVAYPQTVWLIAFGLFLLTNFANNPITIERKRRN